MKIAKKFMALALAAVLSVGCAFCVSADGSRTKDVTVSQEQSQIYEIIQKIEDTEGVKDLQQKYPTIAEAFQKVGEGKMDMPEFIDVLKALATDEKDDGKDFVTGFTQFKVLDATRAEKNADGKYEVEISIPSITDDMENIQLLCYNAEKNEWSVVDPISVDKENKTLKVALDDLCYFSVIADAKADTTK